MSVQCFGNVYQRLNLGDQGVHIRAQTLDGSVIAFEFLFQAGLFQKAFGRDHFGDAGGQFAVLLFQEFGGGFVQRSAEVVLGHVFLHITAELGAQYVLDGRFNILGRGVDLLQDRVHDLILLGSRVFAAGQIFFDSLADVRLDLAPRVERFDLGIEDVFHVLRAHSFGNQRFDILGGLVSEVLDHLVEFGVLYEIVEIDTFEFLLERAECRSVGLQLDFAFQVVDLTFQVVDVVVVILTADGTEQCSGQKHCQKFSEQVVFHSTKD